MWEVRTRYVDWTGEKRQKTKREFERRCDVLEWERQFQLKHTDDVNMTFGAFVEIYKEEKSES